jgi:hypothetical protein
MERALLIPNTPERLREKPMGQPVDGRHVSVPAWIECLNETLNGLVVAALIIASITQMGLLYKGGKPQFRSFSLAACCAAPANNTPA